MKNLLTVILFLFLGQTLNAQVGASLGLGWNLGYAPLGPLNTVIKEYNEVRPTLNKTMNSLHFLKGPEFYFNMEFGPLLLESRWNWQQGKTWAQAPSTGSPNQREVRVRANSFGFGLAIKASNKLPLYPGIMIEGGPEKLYTRVGIDEDVKNQYFILLDSKTSLILTPSVQLRLPLGDHVGIALRPFIKLYLSRIDFGTLRAEVNPVQYDPNEDLRGRTSNIGCSLLLYFRFS